MRTLNSRVAQKRTGLPGLKVPQPGWDVVKPSLSPLTGSSSSQDNGPLPGSLTHQVSVPWVLVKNSGSRGPSQRKHYP